MADADAEESTGAFLAGIVANQNKPPVFCIKGSKSRGLCVPRRSATNVVARCYQIAAPSAHVSEELEKTVHKIKQENHIDDSTSYRSMVRNLAGGRVSVRE